MLLLRSALCCRFNYSNIGASASVVVIVTVVVAIVMVSVVVVVFVAAAAVVVDVLLFRCESRSGADRPCERLHAFVLAVLSLFVVVGVIFGSFAVFSLLLLVL